MSAEAWMHGRKSDRTPVGAGGAQVIDILTTQPRFASYATARQVAMRPRCTSVTTTSVS